MKAADRLLYQRKAQIVTAMGHPIRLAIIDLLAGGEQCVCDIAKHVGAKRSNVSRHLCVLLKSGVVSQRKDGLKMIYALRTPCVLSFMKCVEGVLRENAREAQKVLAGLR